MAVVTEDSNTTSAPAPAAEAAAAAAATTSGSEKKTTSIEYPSYVDARGKDVKGWHPSFNALAKAVADWENGYGTAAPSGDKTAGFDDTPPPPEDKTPETPKDDEAASDEKKADEKKEPLAPKGTLPQTHNIYRSPKDNDGEWTWVDTCPPDLPDPAENEETEQYAVVVRNVKSPSSRKKLEAHSIVIQSPLLKAVLGTVLKGYTGVTCELETLEFEAPFKPFVHRWREFVAYCENPGLEERYKEHLTLLRGILEYEIGDLLRAFEDYMKNGVISFAHLWMIFQPGAVVVSPLKGPLSAFELEETEYLENQCGRFLRLRVDCVDTSGKRFGRSRERIDVPEFLGVKKISSLAASPLSFHPEKDSLKEVLIKRGAIFEGLAGHHFKSYTGTAITWDREGNEVATYVTGRIVVDVKSFNRWSPYPQRSVGDWTPHDMESIASHRLSSSSPTSLPPYLQMLCRSRTRGYSLKLKKWLDFFVDNISEIAFNTDAFDRLVLPEDQKELILAFSESQLDSSQNDNDEEEEEGPKAAGSVAGFDDVITGKGRGVICLLSGPPGVGKTLTAEAVAESLKVPLHTLSSGDLGSSPWEVEHGLSRILELVSRWNAILLLDECDVFLEARSTHDLERNKVVSIFLRTLEYYEGILFMTTNRVGNIDPAFQSRIHVSLEYPDLSQDSRAVIWKNFLGGKDGKGAVLADEDVEELARLKLNGRQIKNVVKTAQLLASRRKEPLKRSFIDTVLAIEKRRPETAAVVEVEEKRG